MTDDDVGEAARRYRAGDSLAKVAFAFNVDAATIRRDYIDPAYQFDSGAAGADGPAC